jgi:hypothetical protein
MGQTALAGLQVHCTYVLRKTLTWAVEEQYVKIPILVKVVFDSITVQAWDGDAFAPKTLSGPELAAFLETP